MTPRLSRRDFVAGTAATGLSLALAGGPALAAPKSAPTVLEAKPADLRLPGTDAASQLWAYNGAVPGPVLRVKQGERVSVRLKNALPEATSVHWHGLRVPNDQDGVPYVTQKPITPGSVHDYSFVAADGGTFFYHPHMNSVAQVGRGLFGALIVEERNAVPVDRDELWAVNDWSVTRQGLLAEDFDNPHDRSHAGRYGNLVTVNLNHRPVLRGRANERIRLRLLNAATGRILAIQFEGLTPWVVAFDGQPIAPRAANADDLLIGPGMRTDLVLDLPDEGRRRLRVADVYDDRAPYLLGQIHVAEGDSKRATPLGPPKRMAANPIPAPDLASARRHEVIFGGGAMGGMMGMGPMNMMSMARRGLFWAINGRIDPPPAETRGRFEPMLELQRGRSYVLSMENRTAFDHPIHLHGHTFQVIARNSQRLSEQPFRDSVMMRPRERVDIAFVADNPGDWMFHCHILSHQVSGMMGVVRVS